MNSTNESSFTEQPNYSKNLITSNLDAAASSFSTVTNGVQQVPLPMSSHRHGNLTGQVSQPGLYSPVRQNSKDSRPFIIMKNKGEENSKLLKQDVAQQIIAAKSGKSHVVNSAKARSNDNNQIKGSPQIIRQQSEAPIAQDNAGGFSPQATNKQEKQDALNIFYKQITNENAQLDRGPAQHPSIAIQGANSQLNKNRNQLPVENGSPVLQKYNSMEMPFNQLNQNNEQSQPVQQIAIQPLNMAKVQEQNIQQQLISGSGRKDANQHLSYRFMNEKRASLPQQLSSEASETDRHDHRDFLKQHIEHVKRNSLQAVPQFSQPINIIIPPQTAGEFDPFETRQGMFAKEGAATLTSPIKSSKLSDAHLSPENADWIKRALDASKTKHMAAEGVAGSERQFGLGSSTMHIPLSGRSSPVGAQSSRLGDNTDSNSKRTRNIIDKKKQFEIQKEQRWRQGQQYTTQQQVTVQQMLAHDRLQSDLLQKSGVKEAVMAAMSPNRHSLPQSVAGTQIGAPNISIKSILPAQAASNVQQSPKMRNLGEHPLSSQQLLNGFSKNVAAASSQVQRPNRRAHQEKAFQQNQGIQGKNITIIHQSKAVAQQASLMRQLGQAQKMATDNTGASTTDDSEAALIKSLESQLDPKDFKALQLLQAQLQKAGLNLNNLGSRKHLLQAMHAAETGQFQPQMITGVAQPLQALATNGKQLNNSLVDQTLLQFGIPKQSTGKLVVFNYNGQTYVRNSETAKIYHAGRAYLQTNDGTEGSERGETEDSGPPSHRSNAASVADQMVQSSMGLRSLSKMLQGAHFEAALQQLVAKQAQAFGADQNYLQQVTLVSAAIGQQPNPSSTMKVRGRGEKIQKAKFTSPQRGTGMRPGESNGSLSTKPTTSTTINSTSQRKGTEGEEAKQNSLTKKGKSGKKESTKQRVHIFHEWDDQLKNHKINKAINTINNIIRLIFKNNKDSSALTTTNNQSSLNGPPGNRLMEEYRIVELQKIAKQINISIPKKFDSKSSLREFFYSREFILNVKIKMNNLLHKAILSANNVPASVIEANMCGNQALAYGAAGREGESKIYQAKKFWVGHGNNYPIVKSVLKQRYWWQYGSEESFGADCDFIWTSWKKQKHIDFLTNSNDKHKQKMSKKQEPAFQEENQGNEAAATAAASQIQNETEQKITNNQDSKLQKRKLRGPGGAASITAVEPKEPVREEALVAATPQETARIDRIAFPLRLYNKLEQNKQLTNKKGVFVNMRKYYESLGQDPFKVLPLTFHTQQGVNDPEFRRFSNYYNQVEQRYRASERQAKEAVKQFHADKRDAANKKKAKDDDYASEVDTDDEDAIEKIYKKYRAPQNTWIIKPGENTNRGQGITVVKTIKEVQSIIGRPSKKDDRTFIIQKYIDYPLLVHKRKFDFRCFGLLTSINGSLKGYCYQDGYIRTSCREYTLDDVTDQFIHLTNDAIQQKSDDYGKFENGNKLSWQDFTKVVSAQQPELDFDFHRDIFPQIQKLVADTFKAAFIKIDPQRLQNTFELFGYDFMIDEDFRLYLIEVNTNPCLEVCCPLLARIIPEVLDNSFKIVLDPLFPSPDLSHNRKFQLNELPQEVKFQLVFDEDVEGEQIRANMTRGTKGSIREAVGEEDIESDKENELAEDDGEDY